MFMPFILKTFLYKLLNNILCYILHKIIVNSELSYFIPGFKKTFLQNFAIENICFSFQNRYFAIRKIVLLVLFSMVF